MRLTHLYSAHTALCSCPSCQSNTINLSDDNFFDAPDMDSISKAAFDKSIEKVYNGKTKLSDVDRAMYEQYFQRFRNAIGGNTISVSYNPDWAFNQLLLTHASSFAAFKNHTNTAMMVQNLIDPDTGFLKTFAQFRADVLPYMRHANENWLQAEYQTAIASSRMAIKWQDIEREAHIYPNLEYVTQKDDRVRPEHRLLDGIIRPVNDPFWKTHYPPNGWRCRCLVKQTTSKPTAEPTPNIILDTDFAQNVGQSAELWGKDHPYFAEADINKAFIERAAKAYHANLTKKEVTTWAVDNLLGNNIAIPELESALVIESAELEAILSASAENQATRNEFLYILQDLASTATLLTGTLSTTADIIRWYYYTIEIQNIIFYITVAEQTNKKLTIHSITDTLLYQ